jgi:hypothetical protein
LEAFFARASVDAADWHSAGTEQIDERVEIARMELSKTSPHRTDV